MLPALFGNIDNSPSTYLPGLGPSWSLELKIQGANVTETGNGS